MNIKYSELKKKEVFNVLTGENYGKIQDLILNKKSGQIEKIIVPGKKNNFLNCESLEIKYSEIEKIGQDAILIKRGGKKEDCAPPCNDICTEEIAVCDFDDE